MHAESWLVLSTLLLILEHGFVQADDWPQWRGPLRNNISLEMGLLETWPEEGPQLRYRIKGLGAGIAAPAVVGKQAFTISEFNGYEVVVAFDTETGERLWVSPLGLESKDFVAVHPLMRWLSQRTPTVHNGKLYAVTAYGVLTCLATADGKQLWSKDFRKEYGVSRQTWGYCDYPLVDGDMLICVPGATHPFSTRMKFYSPMATKQKL